MNFINNIMVNVTPRNMQCPGTYVVKPKDTGTILEAWLYVTLFDKQCVKPSLINVMSLSRHESPAYSFMRKQSRRSAVE